MGPDPAVATVRRAVRTSLAALSPPDRARPLLVALSGGPDSVALAAATVFTADRAGHRAGAVVVDHGLQDESADVAARAATLAFELGLDPVHVVRVDVADHPGAGGPEGAARTARYAAIDSVAAAENALVLLGHTRDDQAETVLLGLGRGSGPRSIAGMRRRDGRYLRPFLDVDRAITERTCAVLGLPVWHDPHNLDPRFRRVRLRREVLPLLEDVLGGGVAGALARTADLVRSDLDAMDQWSVPVTAQPPSAPGTGVDETIAAAPDTDQSVRDTVTALLVSDLQTHPAAVRTRVLRRWANRGGAGALTSVHLDALDRLTAAPSSGSAIEGRQTHLPGGYLAVRRSGRLHLRRIDDSEPTTAPPTRPPDAPAPARPDLIANAPDRQE